MHHAYYFAIFFSGLLFAVRCLLDVIWCDLPEDVGDFGGVKKGQRKVVWFWFVKKSTVDFSFMFLPFQFKSLAQYELSDTKMEPYQEYVESCISRYQMTHDVMRIRIPTNQLPVGDFTKEVYFKRDIFKGGSGWWRSLSSRVSYNLDYSTITNINQNQAAIIRHWMRVCYRFLFFKTLGNAKFRKGTYEIGGFFIHCTGPSGMI